MIIKRGECKELEKCLGSLNGHISEIVAVVDPTPMDNDITDDILLKYGAKEILYPWPKDYSKARNESLKYISSDWVLVIDTDEYITHFNVDESNLHSDAYRVIRENEYIEEDNALLNIERITRFFRNGLFHYEGKVHEQLVRNDSIGYHAKDIMISLGHTGYTDRSHMLEKSEIYRSLLEQMIKENGADPYVYFQIGRTYYVERKYTEAAEAFEKAIESGADTKDEYVESLIETYGYCLLETGRSKEALALTGFNEYDDSADYHFLNGLIYMNNTAFDIAIQEFEKATFSKKVAVSGTDSYAALYNCGVICEVLGDKARAENYYRKAGDYPPALEGLRRL